MKIPQLQQQLRKHKISHLLLFHDDPNFTYFTRLKHLTFAILAIPQRGQPLLFLHRFDQQRKSKLAKIIHLEKPFKTFLHHHLQPKTIAYNSLNLTLATHQQLKKIFPKTKFKDFSQQLQLLRKEKTPSEIRYPKKAAKLTVQAYEQIIKKLKRQQFKTERDIEFFIQTFAHQHNTELSFPSIVASGKNTCQPHHQTSNQKLKRGFLLLDFGISYQHYCSDMTRMLYLGKPTKKELALYNFLLDIQEDLIRSLKPDLLAHQLETQARKKLGQYSSYFIHGLGHGVGVEIHETPSLKLASQDLIKNNQIFTIEPGIYLKNFGLRIEDTIWMNKGKPVILTKTPKKLLLLPVPKQ